METKNTKVNEVLTLGNISETNLKKEVSTLRETEINQGEILMNWNSNLVKESKWYDVSNSKLPLEFQKIAKETLAVEFFNKPENMGLLGKKKIADVDVNVTLEMVLNSDLKILKEKYNVKTSDTVKDIRRTFSKDFYDKKVNKWKADAKALDNSDGNSEVLKKEKANRTFLEMLAWNILGEPDQYSNEGYSNSMLRKCINSKDTNKPKAKEFETLAKKFLKDIESISGIQGSKASAVIKNK